MSKIEVDAIDKQSGSTLTLGGSGTAVTLACGATQSGFGRSGSVNWQTTPKTATFTAANGEGYFINQGSAITANLPAGSAGAIVAFSDYARNFSTYNLTISPNGSEKIGGIASNVSLNVDGQAATFVYVDSTKGWVNVQNAEDTEAGQTFMAATGGTVTTVCTNFKVHTFTGPGTFCVSSIGSPGANNEVSYVVVGAGAGGGWDRGAGGGAGGYRENKSGVDSYTASPLDGGTPITVTATAFPITVGSGGAGGTSSGPYKGVTGGVSTFSTVTSAGGGGGGAANPPSPPQGPGNPGGSGGGASSYAPSGTTTGGTGNQPPVSPAQGTDGGPSVGPSYAPGGGGGGATAAGTSATPGVGNGVAGGAGATSSITGSPAARAGGGGGGASYCCGSTCRTGGAGGTGGGATGGNSPGGGAGGAGTANTGGGGGGGGNPSPSGPSVGGNGGSGVVIIRYKFQ